MRAIVITRPGGPEVLELRDVPRPQPADKEVLVRVHAAGVNRADLLQRQGRYPAPPGVPPDIPGLEFAGEVEGLGPGARRWKKGERVVGLAGGGAYAEFVVAHEDTLAAIPANLDWNEAGGVPEIFITAHDAMIRQAGLRTGEAVLIHAVGSGVGLAAVQLARAVGATPFGTSRTADKIERAREYGLEDGAAITDVAQLAELATRWSSGRGLDVVLDLVGGPYLGAELGIMASRGRIMVVGTVAGGRSEIELRHLIGKRLHVIGTALRSRSLAEKIEVTRAFAAEVVPWLAQGTAKPVLDAVFPLEQAAEAHARLEANANFGKVVLSLGTVPK